MVAIEVPSWWCDIYLVLDGHELPTWMDQEEEKAVAREIETVLNRTKSLAIWGRKLVEHIA